MRRLRRQIRDLARAACSSAVFTKRFALYCDVSRDIYAVNDAPAGTFSSVEQPPRRYEDS